jgi:hypothetical protein
MKKKIKEKNEKMDSIFNYRGGMEKILFIVIIKFHQMENIIIYGVKIKIALEPQNLLLNQNILL